MSAVVAQCFLISGRVQGVGFRRTAKLIADKYPVAGYVQNLSDGRVELSIEGQQQVVADYIVELQKAMADYIRRVECQDLTPVGTQGFAIRS